MKEKIKIYGESKKIKAATVEENSDHLIKPSLEDNPDVYKTVLVGDKSKAMAYFLRGSRLAISINMENFHIYIGSDHLNMQNDANISDQNLCAAFAKFDRATNQVIVEDFADWRKGISNEIGIKKAIAATIQRDLIKI